MTLKELDSLFAQILDFDTFEKIDTINGIQIANTSPATKNIERIAVAVDASIPIIHAAVLQKVDLLLVHHGLFWGTNAPLTQSTYAKVKPFITHNIALYAIHLPLDAHIELGNNAQIARKIGLMERKPCALYKNVHIGVQGFLQSATNVEDILHMLFAYPHAKNNTSSCSYHGDCTPYAMSYGVESYAISSKDTVRKKEKVFPPQALSLALHGPKKVQKIAIVSGTGHSFLDEAHADDVEMLITGDASHIAALRAYELSMHVVSAGHYFTEIWGVLALGAYVQKTQNLQQVIFLDNPTQH